jgi:hypothetical protein
VTCALILRHELSKNPDFADADDSEVRIHVATALEAAVPAAGEVHFQCWLDWDDDVA